MKKLTVVLAIVCSVVVGATMAVTLHVLHMQIHGSAAAQTDHMDHAAHMAAMAQQHQHHPGQEMDADPRPEFHAIKSLSAEEIEAYQKGMGHGMAKAGEQNHYPGPRHILDHATELGLSASQSDQIRTITDNMKQQAIATGNQIIENERKLNELFANKTIDQQKLEALVAETAVLQGKLRLIHLTAHLQTVKILTPQQIAEYDRLQGYTVMAQSHNSPM